MSGIGAVFNLDGSEVPQAEIERMANCLKPYGPDRQQILHVRGAAFVFCLHSFTPEDVMERQPHIFANRLVMLFDGRIDNRTELGETMGMTSSEMRSLPDSAIALNLFVKRGEAAFELIIGDFSVVVMDLQDGHLLCARDPMGLRALHYHLSPGRFAVATVPEGLFALSWIPRILNQDKVADILVNRGLNPETTYYKGVDRVPPGFLVRVRGGTLSKDQYWNPENIADVRFKSDHDYVDALRQHLDIAVRARLRSRRVPCATITGGLDSSTISVLAADMLSATGNKLNTFTAVPEAGFNKEEIRGRYFDEFRRGVGRIAEFNPNIVPHFVRPSSRPLLKQMADHVKMGGLPTPAF